jgi:hypothetical protein
MCGEFFKVYNLFNYIIIKKHAQEIHWKIFKKKIKIKSWRAIQKNAS